jgi:hypothetical protein
LAATQPKALRAYRVLTIGWALVLVIKSAGSYWLGANFAAKDFLLFSPLWDLVSDSVLVAASILYARKALATPSPPLAAPTAVVS